MLHDEFFHVMRRVVQEHTARWQEAGVPVTKPQYAVLRAIDEVPGSEQTALAVASSTTKATLTEILGRLESAGLITRRTDALDRRKRYVDLTPAGATLLASSRRLATAVNESFLTHLDPGERATLRALLLRLEGD
ncbi:MarR family winged helix-turn-helix transcriptional regulator [Frondihabitans peucedani]|jgi:DNA-binding MarR family transcriptional regulator|uniref:MarR family transcriptional regulator n=1 Tax=Frondihabitans peucedani TaxID=598626 RepID=A0ABP8E173_9MICO